MDFSNQDSIFFGEWDPKVTEGFEGSEGSFVIFDENPNNIGV